MKCSTCNTENTLDAKFCKTCGSTLENESSQGGEATTVVERPSFDEFILNNRFRVIKKLGKGGMGEVLLAEDVKLKRRVAIKSILLKDNLSDSSSKLRFLREAQTASQLDHTNICTIYEIYEEGDKDYILMQYIDGVTLDQVIGSRKLSIDKILDIAIQVCNGMSEAHSKDIIHRDIKPSNIMIDKKGTVKILDFGLAKFTENGSTRGDQLETNLTEKGFVMGTIAYISPEQARGKALDRRTDIFSFGTVLFEMIEGINPFKVDEQIETLYNVLNKAPHITREIPQELEDIVDKALEKDREKRYQEFDDIRKDLEEFRTLYNELKESTPKGGATEIIQVEEQSKMLEEIQKTSDKENLGDLVYRIKKFNASTERVVTVTPEPRIFKKPWMKWAIPTAAAFIILLSFFFVFKKEKPGPTPGPQFKKPFVYLKDFMDDTGEKNNPNMPSVPQMLTNLFMESLNQFPEFETIDSQTAADLSGEKDEQKAIKILRDKFHFNIKYEFSGKISKRSDSFIIDAAFKTIDSGDSSPLTSTGQFKDSFLTNQVDELSESIYSKVLPEKKDIPRIRRISDIYGSQWTLYSDFVQGFSFYKRADLGKSEKYFKKSQELLAGKYYYAEVCFYNGDRAKAKELIDAISPDLRKLTNALQLKVKSIDARLKFKYDEASKSLEELVKELPFSKEAFYNLGEVYFHSARPETAITYYKKALELDPKYAQAMNHLGYCYSYLGDHRNAIDTLERFRQFDPSSNSFDSFGDGYFFAGKLDRAESMKLTAVEPEPDGSRISWPFQTLADIYVLKAQYNKAVNALNEYKKLANSPTANAYVLERFAYIDYIGQQFQPALDKINQSLSIFDTDDINESAYEQHMIKGLILTGMNNITEAKTEWQWLKKCIDRYQFKPGAFHAVLKDGMLVEAMIAEKENQPDKAIQIFKTIIDMKSSLSYWITYFNYQFFHTEYVKLLIRLKKFEEALVEVNKCLEFNPDYVPALWAKAQTLEALNKQPDAVSVYEQIADIYGNAQEKNYYTDLLKTKLK